MLYLIGAIVLGLLGLKLLLKAYFPEVLNFIMKTVHSYLCDVKSEHFKEAFSRVKTGNNGKLEILELGIGCGENFLYFPRGSNVTILDKTDIFLPYLTDSIKKNNRHDLTVSKLVVNSAETMTDIKSNSMDVVVHTFTLCSVDDYRKVLSEVYRVLKPGGVGIFMEHSIDTENKARRLLQKSIQPMCGDCKFLDMNKVLKSGQFDELILKKFTVRKNLLTFINPVVYGYGIKQA